MEGGQGPGGGPILLPIRGSVHFAENAFLFDGRVSLGLAASVARFEGREPALVEAAHQLRHGIATASSRRTVRFGEALPVGNRQDRFGTCHHPRRFGVRPAQAQKLPLLLNRQQAKRIFGTARQGQLTTQLTH